MEIDEASEDIDIAFRQLEFAIRLLSYCGLGKINSQDFDTDHLVMLENGSLHFPSKHFSDTDSIIRAASISVLIAFSTSVLVLDQGFRVLGIKPDPEATDNVQRLRTVIYMVRHAQAHCIADPKWKVDNKYLRTITVDLADKSFSLDLQKLNGRSFVIDQLGGYETWYRIRNAVDHVFTNLSRSRND